MATKEQSVDSTMYCPRCLSPLIIGPGLRVYQTLVEHVMYPDTPSYSKRYHICSRDTCLTRKYDTFWDDSGDSYVTLSAHEDIFILNESKAINSSMRKLSIEQKRLYRTLLHIGIVKLGMQSSPITDRYGTKILCIKRTFKIILRSNHGWEEYSPGIRMFLFCFKQFNYAFNRFMEDPEASWTHSEMLSFIDPKEWDKRWWRLLSARILNRLYPTLKELLLRIKKN